MLSLSQLRNWKYRGGVVSVNSVRGVLPGGS